MENRGKYLLKNISIFTLSEFGTKIISFFLVPLYTYILTTNQYGTIDLIFTISTVLTPLIMLNIGEAIMRYSLDEDTSSDKIMSVGIINFIFGIIIALIFVPIFSINKILDNYKWYMYFYIVLCATKSMLNGYLRGNNKLKHYAISNILNAILIVIFNIIFLIFLKKGIDGYLFAYILSEIFVIIYIILFGKVLNSIKKLKFDKKLTVNMIKFSLAIVPNSLLWWIINSSDRIMVSYFQNLSQTGLLAVSYKIPSLLVVLNTILMQSWKYSAIKEKDSQDNEKFTNIMFDKFFRLSILISSFLILIIKPLTKILFEASYYESWIASIFLLIGFVFLGISTFIGTIYYVKKDMIGNMISALFGAILNIIFNLIFIPIMGFSGAALGATLSYLSILLYRYYNTKKYQTIHLFKKEYIILCVLILIMIISNILNNLIGNIISVICFILVLLNNYKFILKNIINIINIIKFK